MEVTEAKQHLKNFLGGRVLTFSMKEFDNGEWVAECNEIPGIITGGVGDYTERDQLIRDAIVSAAGIDTKFASTILENRGAVPVTTFRQIFKMEVPRVRYVVPA